MSKDTQHISGRPRSACTPKWDDFSFPLSSQGGSALGTDQCGVSRAERRLAPPSQTPSAQVGEAGLRLSGVAGWASGDSSAPNLGV